MKFHSRMPHSGAKTRAMRRRTRNSSQLDLSAPLVQRLPTPYAAGKRFAQSHSSDSDEGNIHQPESPASWMHVVNAAG